MKISPFLLRCLATVSVPVLAAAILFPVFGRARENARKSSCQSNLKQIGLGFAQYEQDYGDRLPLVQNTTYKVIGKGTSQTTTGVYGWADALQPYLKSVCIFNCPSDLFPPDFQTVKGSYTDYYMNARLSGAKVNRTNVTSIVLGGDGVGNKNATARYALSASPTQILTCGGYNDSCESAWRHLGQANFLFLDGHVKSLAPDQVSVTKGVAATFAP